MSQGPDETVVRVWARLMTAGRLALTAVERDLKTAGLPPLVWYDVLLEVERAGSEGLRPYELEKAMLLAQYNLSRLIDRIEGAGLVERRACEDDGRGHRIAITEQGKSTRRRMWPVYARSIEKAVGRHLTRREAETLDGLLGVLVAGQRDSR